MGNLLKISIVVLGISFITFVLFFGRLPALRRTPIGALSRLLVVRLPAALYALDLKISSGRGYSTSAQTFRFIMNEKHPTILIAFILLLAVSEYLYLPAVFPIQPFSTKVIMFAIIAAPYIFLYLSTTVDPGSITLDNHCEHLALYTYDHANFHPKVPCRTCLFYKPARSKHCSICKRCVARCDHHCIFINACVGYGNMHWFILLLFSTAVLTMAGGYLGVNHGVYEIKKTYPEFTATGKGYSWKNYGYLWAFGLNRYPAMAGVSLLCVLCTPLVIALLGYNVYQLWAGITTNESGKWDDTKLDIADKFLFKRSIDKDRRRRSQVEPFVKWPKEAEIVVLSREQKPEEDNPGLRGRGIGPWTQVENIHELENIYDIGFWNNVKDVFLPRSSEGKQERGGLNH